MVTKRELASILQTVPIAAELDGPATGDRTLGVGITGVWTIWAVRAKLSFQVWTWPLFPELASTSELCFILKRSGRL